MDEFDYKEPRCTLCGGKEFYYPDKDAPKERIPVGRIIEKVDAAFSRGDLTEAGRVLEHWQQEAKDANDKNGELSIVNELLGYYRKTGDKENALYSVSRAKELIADLGLETALSSATIYLNAATTLKAFGGAENALPLYDTAEKIYADKLPKSDALWAGFYNNKALALSDLKDYEGAEKCFLLAMEVNAKSGDKLHDAVTLVNLAHLYYDAGKEKAVIDDCLFKAYGIINDAEKRDGYFAFVLEKCAPSFGFFGYPLIEKDFMKESREIYERS